MPWCPKCKTEYREGVLICPDCNTELVPKLATLKDAPTSRDRKSFEEMGEYRKEDWVSIMDVSNVQEAEMIIGLLDANDIHAVTKDRLGALRNLYGDIRFFDEKIKIYVLKKEAEKALGIIEEIRSMSEDELSEMITDLGGFERLEVDEGDYDNEHDDEEEYDDEDEDYDRPA